MWFILAGSLLSWKDRTVQMRAARIELLLNALPRQREDMIGPRLDEIVGLLPEGQLIRIVGTDGQRLFPLDTPPATPAISLAPCPQPAIETDHKTKDNYRRLCHPVSYGGTPGYLIVPTSLQEDQLLLSSFTGGLCRIAPILLLVSSIGGYTLSRRALRPVGLLIAEARTITGKDLSRRLPVPAAEDEMRRLALEWNGLLSRIQQAVERVTQFTADASHELRNPIAYIRATAEFHINTPSLDEEARLGFQEILDETKCTSDLVENLLTLARADSGYIHEDVNDVFVAPVMDEVCNRMLPLAQARQQNLTWNSGNSTSSSVLRINPLHLRRLLTILLDNAIKYTPAGGSVSVKTWMQDEWKLQIADTGIGIAPEHLPRVFNRFYRVDAARSDANSGVGLGLPIAKWLVELYSGCIHIESEKDHGTTVTVAFPLNPDKGAS